MSSSARKILSLLLILSGLFGTACSGLNSLSSTESDAELYGDDDGPISLPVTIAKLEAPDALNITVELSSSSDLIRSLSATSAGTAAIEGAGDASDESGRAIHDPDATPFVLIYNHDTDEQTVAAVASDGSFSAEIAADAGESIGVYAITSSDLSAATSSPGIFYTVDSLGTVTVTVSNSGLINDDMPMSVAPDASVFFAVNGASDSYELWRRNLDGSLPERLLSGHAAAPLVAVSVSSGGVASEQSVLLLDRGVDLLLRPAGTEGDDESDWTTLLGDIGTIADDEDNQSTRAYRLQTIDEDTFLLKYPSSDGATQILKTLDLDGTTETILDGALGLGPTRLSSLNFSTPTSTSHLFLSYEDADTSRSYVFDLDLQGTEADFATGWSARVTLAETDEYDVLDLAATEDGTAVMLVRFVGSGAKKLLLLSSDGTVTVVADLSAQDVDLTNRIIVPRLPNGDPGIVACDENNGSASKRLLYYSLATVTATGGVFQIEPQVLVANEDLRSCRHFAVTSVGDALTLLHFFTAASETDSSQLSFVILEQSGVVP